VYKHHKGICCRCGRDLETLGMCVNDALFMCKPDWGGTEEGYAAWHRLRKEVYGGSGVARRLWNAHHRKPVSQGGRNTLQNGELLCLWCHKAAHATKPTIMRSHTPSRPAPTYSPD